jgi:hypothetical protein
MQYIRSSQSDACSPLFLLSANFSKIFFPLIFYFGSVLVLFLPLCIHRPFAPSLCLVCLFLSLWLALLAGFLIVLGFCLPPSISVLERVPGELSALPVKQCPNQGIFCIFNSEPAHFSSFVISSFPSPFVPHPLSLVHTVFFSSSL